MGSKASIKQQLTDKIDAKQQFQIQFSQYNEGLDTFFPIYSDVGQRNFDVGDVIAWFWGQNLTFGHIVTAFNQSCLMVETITREYTHRPVKTQVARDQIVCRFMPE